MEAVTLSKEELRILFSCGCPAAVSLYLYRKSGEPLELAMDTLCLGAQQIRSASDCLRGLGLWQQTEKPTLPEPERPTYTEQDLHRAMTGRKGEFQKLVGEAQCRLGRTLSTEELKTLLSFVDYLRMPVEVAALLISYCVERNRRRGVRAPTMRTVEKEAYRWADANIDTLESAISYMQGQLQIHTRIHHLRDMMQIRDRRLTQTEEQYLTDWITMGFPDDVIAFAYEKTCVNTGGLKWPYMNSILKSWDQKKLHTLRDIAENDSAPKAPQKANPKDRNSMYQKHSQTTLTPMEREGILRVLEEV